MVRAGGRVAELATALRISPRSIDAQIERARRLVTAHPGTCWLLSEGHLGREHARVVVDECSALSDHALLAAVEARVLRRAPEQTPARLRAAVRRAIAQLDPAGEIERHEVAATQVGVTRVALPNALVMITAVLPAPEAGVVMGALDALADLHAGLQRADKAPEAGGGAPTRAARRADALVELCSAIAADPGILPALRDAEPVRPLINVTVSLDCLLGFSDNPGELEGYGPIPAPMARALAADGTWARFITDPGTGALLDSTPYRYGPGAALRAHVVVRDVTCRHPNCATSARRCDLDHVVEFDHHHPERGGPTTRSGLAARCRRHHNNKTWHGRIQVVVATPGSVVEDRSSSLNASAGVRHSRVLRGLPLSEAAASSRSCRVN
ncbi:MAG: hypothetical protein JWM71_2054 [Solirubrobacteraceae bacterium]|nr:hypothetical protein [Solirubrobacteraceae bacterium]